jgi:decaprenyl-phosphate phosphoribosyltransferase
LNPYLRAIRLERWPRSTAIFLGSAAYLFLYRDLSPFTDLNIILRLLLSFLLTWFISTASYIINEIADAPYDIHHPTKRNRPLVKGEIKIIPFSLLGFVLILAALIPAFLIYSSSFFFSLLTLLIAGFIYNLKPVRTKDIPFLDAISESANNPIRFLIGWFALSPSNIFPPLSLLICWWAFGNFLLVAKRLSEFRLLQEKAGDYRASLKKYSNLSLLMGMTVSAVVFFLTYFYFAFAFRFQSLFLFSPFLLFYFFLFFRKTMKEEEVMEEPEQLLKTMKFALYTIFLVLLFVLSFFIDRPGQ